MKSRMLMFSALTVGGSILYLQRRQPISFCPKHSSKIENKSTSYPLEPTLNKSQLVVAKGPLIDLCHSLWDSYKNTNEEEFLKYKNSLEEIDLKKFSLTEYQQSYNGETPLTLLVKINDLQVAWHLYNLLQQPPFQEIINGTTDITSPLYKTAIPLIHAVKANSIYCTRALLHNKANPHVKDQFNKSALDYAIANNNQALIDLLQRFGAAAKQPSNLRLAGNKIY